MNKNWMAIDVESIGLHGEAFAVGVVQIVDGRKSGEFIMNCHPLIAEGTDEDQAWVAANVPPMNGFFFSPISVRKAFWEQWIIWKDGYGADTLIADCAWPVEANFLRACIADDAGSRKWLGPYPLHDLASMMLALGKDPLVKYPRLPDELPEHNPLNDARQSARLLMEILA